MFHSCPSMYLSDSGSETSDAVHIIKVGIIQAVAAVAVFFFIYVGDPKHLLSQTQKFNKVFLRKNEKRAVFGEKNSLKTALK